MAAEADACAKEVTQILKQRMVTQKDEAAECIQMVRKLGEPIESLQVGTVLATITLDAVRIKPASFCLGKLGNPIKLLQYGSGIASHHRSVIRCILAYTGVYSVY